MSAKPEGKNSSSAPRNFDIKSAQLSTVAVVLRSTDIPELVAGLLAQYGPNGESVDFFEHEAAVLDLAVFSTEEIPEAFGLLLRAMRTCHLIPVATRNAPQAWNRALQDMGLVDAPLVPLRTTQTVKTSAQELQSVAAVKEVVARTMVIDKPLRSGQKVYARGADLVVLAMVNQGAEVVADGNIHVYAPLRGKAMAGARGDVNARIFTTCLEPELISIAGVYRTSEARLPQDVAAKPAQVRLSSDGLENLIIEPLRT